MQYHLWFRFVLGGAPEDYQTIVDPSINRMSRDPYLKWPAAINICNPIRNIGALAATVAFCLVAPSPLAESGV